MKKLIFIALMFGFLIGNAQQDRQPFGPNSSKDPVQLDKENHPGYPSEIDLYSHSIRKTDFHPGYPSEIDLYRNSIRKTDNHPGYPSEIDLYRNSIRKTDNINLGFPSEIDLYRYTIRKTD